nr:methyl-accepting chemotaxis protein [uncultured Desulfobacter sp.]
MKLSLKSKLILGGIIASMLPLAIIGYFSVSKSTHALVANAEFQSLQIAKDLAMLAEEIVSQEIIYAESLAQAPVITKAVSNAYNSDTVPTDQALQQFLVKVFNKCQGRYESIVMTNQEGTVIADNTKQLLSASLSDRDYFNIAKQGRTNLSDPLLSKASGHPIVCLAVPLRTASNQFGGALVFLIKLNRLSDKITAVKIGETGYPFMIDKTGLVISHPSTKIRFEVNIAKTEGMEKIAKRMIAQEAGVELYKFRGATKIAGFAPVHSTGWSITVTQNEDEFLGAVHSIQRLVVIVGLFFLIIIVLGILIFVKGIMVQLGGEPGDIAAIADSIADGNLTTKFEEKAGKSTGIYASMKKMTGNLVEILTQITDGTRTLTSSSSELAGISEKMATNAEQTSQRANTVAAAAEEMTANMTGVAAATEQTSANIQMIVAAAEEMSSTISEIASNTAKGSQTTMDAVKQAEEVSTKVNDLGQAASQISRVTETIAEISEQTNLLALNATIEAARAGESGKGFAVVAGEIKALAQQTADATSEIGSRIGEVQATTKESVDAIESIVKVINEINSIVTAVAAAIEEQSATTQEIAHNVSQAGQGVNEVNENVTQASVVAGEVSQDVQIVSQASGEMRDGSTQVNESSLDLSKLAERLNQLVARFALP